MRNWEQHKAIEDRPPSSRCEKMLRVHRTQLFDAISRTEEGDMGHSILQKDMPDDEDYHCEPNKRRKLRYWLPCFHLNRSWPVAQRKSAWTLWFCQYLGEPLPRHFLGAEGERQDWSRRPTHQGFQH